MTPRKAGVLAAQLPPGAQTWVAVGSDAAWSVEAHHLAAVFDATQVGNWQRGSGKEGDLPTPMRRPSDLAEEVSKRDRVAARAQAALERQRVAEATPQPRARDARGRFVKEA